MNILKFTVTKNHLVKTGAVTTTAGSTLYDYAQFTFDSDWTGLDIVVYFSRGTAVYTPPLISGTDLTDLLYEVPDELLAVAGAYEVNVVGTNAAGVRIVTNKVSQPVDKSGYTDGTIPVTPTPTLYAQMLAEFDEATAACEEYAEDALNAQHAAEEAAASVPDLTQAVSDAQAAKTAAEDAQTAIENMTVSGESVAPDVTFDVEKTVVGGVANLHFKIPTGENGADGKEIQLQTSATHIQWRYEGDATWTDLVALADISGADGVGVPVGGTTGQMLAKNSNTDFDTEWVNAPDVSNKADKVTGATNGNFAGLDANGNLADSGKKAADFAEASHGHDLSSLTADSTHRLVTDTEKTTWNAKQAAITEGTDYVGISANYSGKAKAERITAPIRADITTDTTLALTDAGLSCPVNSSSAITVTIPTNSAVAFPIGTEIEILRKGSGTVALSVTDLTIWCSSTARTIKSQYGSVFLKKYDTDTWHLNGDLG